MQFQKALVPVLISDQSYFWACGHRAILRFSVVPEKCFQKNVWKQLNFCTGLRKEAFNLFCVYEFIKSVYVRRSVISMLGSKCVRACLLTCCEARWTIDFDFDFKISQILAVLRHRQRTFLVKFVLQRPLSARVNEKVGGNVYKRVSHAKSSYPPRCFCKQKNSAYSRFLLVSGREWNVALLIMEGENLTVGCWITAVV